MQLEITKDTEIILTITKFEKIKSELELQSSLK